MPHAPLWKTGLSSRTALYSSSNSWSRWSGSESTMISVRPSSVYLYRPSGPCRSSPNSQLTNTMPRSFGFHFSGPCSRRKMADSASPPMRSDSFSASSGRVPAAIALRISFRSLGV